MPKLTVNWNYVTDNFGKIYEEKSGVAIKGKYYTKEDFENWFNDLLKDSYQEQWLKFREITLKARKFISLTEKKKSIVQFTSDLDQIARGFVDFTGIGGDISLMTTLDFQDEKEQKTYYLERQEALLSGRLDEIGQNSYYNSQKELQKLKAKGEKLTILNDALVEHLNGFFNQLTTENYYKAPAGTKDYCRLKVWSYYNMKNRYLAMRRARPRPTIAKYFWGKTLNVHGYVAEAYGLHLALKHPEFRTLEDVKLRSEVIAEHGGPGSFELFSLLNSTKGNVTSWLGGDIITVDKNGNIKYNIQSKGSRRSDADFTIAYQQFLSNITQFIDIYEKYLSSEEKIRQIEKEDLEILFKAFSSKAWVEMENETEEKLNKLADELLMAGIPKGKKK